MDTYSELQSEALAWMRRAGQSAKAPLWIQLAEAKLNRKIDYMEVESTLDCEVSSREVDISALSVKEPVALFLTENNGNELELTPKAKGTFPFADTDAKPRYWSTDDDDIIFDCPADETYSLRFVYRQTLALSDAAPTNWLLTDHPDVYLAATLMWGAGYNEAWEHGTVWKSLLDEAIPEIKSQITARKRAVLTVDPTLQMIGRRRYLYTQSDL